MWQGERTYSRARMALVRHCRNGRGLGFGEIATEKGRRLLCCREETKKQARLGFLDVEKWSKINCRPIYSRLIFLHLFEVSRYLHDSSLHRLNYASTGTSQRMNECIFFMTLYEFSLKKINFFIRQFFFKWQTGERYMKCEKLESF